MAPNIHSSHSHLAVGQRPGAFAVYLEPWHSDVFDFLELKKNTGKEEQRARDLFFALWIPDLFMKRVESNQVTNIKISLRSISRIFYFFFVMILIFVLTLTGLVSDVSQ